MLYPLMASCLVLAALPAGATPKRSSTAALPGGLHTVLHAEAARLPRSTLGLSKAVITGLSTYIDHPSAPPRLVFDDAHLMANARVTTWRSGYAISVRTAQRSFVLHASGKAVSVPSARPSAAAMPDPQIPLISRAHAIVSFDVVIAGAAYTLDIECRNGPKDSACGGDQVGLNMVANLKRWVP